MYLYDAQKYGSCQDSLALPDFSGPFGQSGDLRRFSPDELVLSPDDTVKVLRFFWPDADVSRLGPITDADRGFAQALLLEAIEASCTMGIVESIYKKFFLKVPTTFSSIARSVAAIVVQALKNRWFKRCSNIQSADAKVYESIRSRLALNFRSVIQLRMNTGELTF